MNRNIRRIPRNPELFNSPYGNISGFQATETSIKRSPGHMPPTCGQTLPQKVTALENEVADINCVLAEQTHELNNHETRLQQLESHMILRPQPLPCLPQPYPQPLPCLPQSYPQPLPCLPQPCSQPCPPSCSSYYSPCPPPCPPPCHSSHSSNPCKCEEKEEKKKDECCPEKKYEPYARNIIFEYKKTYARAADGILYLDVVDPNEINPTSNVNKLPISICNADPCFSIADEIIPLDSGVAFLLPFDSFIYQISFSAELKINTESAGVVTPLGSIYYLSNSNNPTSQPAIARVIVYQLNQTNTIVDINIANQISFTWNNIDYDPASPNTPPGNFMIFQDLSIPGQNDTYYKTHSTHHSSVFNISPILDSNGLPFGRRLVSIVVTRGFSFNKANMTIVRLPI